MEKEIQGSRDCTIIPSTFLFLHDRGGDEKELEDCLRGQSAKCLRGLASYQGENRSLALMEMVNFVIIPEEPPNPTIIQRGLFCPVAAVPFASR